MPEGPLIDAAGFYVEIVAPIKDALENLEKYQEQLEKTAEVTEDETDRMNQFMENWGDIIVNASIAAGNALASFYTKFISKSPAVSIALAEMGFAAELLGWAMGDILAPAFELIADVMWFVLDVFDSMPPSVKLLVSAFITFLALAAPLAAFRLIAWSSILPLAGALALVVVGIGGFIDAVKDFKAAWDEGDMVGAFIQLIRVAGYAMTAIGGVVALIGVFTKNLKWIAYGAGAGLLGLGIATIAGELAEGREPTGVTGDVLRSLATEGQAAGGTVINNEYNLQLDSLPGPAKDEVTTAMDTVTKYLVDVGGDE